MMQSFLQSLQLELNTSSAQVLSDQHKSHHGLRTGSDKRQHLRKSKSEPRLGRFKRKSRNQHRPRRQPVKRHPSFDNESTLSDRSVRNAPRPQRRQSFERQPTSLHSNAPMPLRRSSIETHIDASQLESVNAMPATASSPQSSDRIDDDNALIHALSDIQLFDAKLSSEDNSSSSSSSSSSSTHSMPMLPGFSDRWKKNLS